MQGWSEPQLKEQGSDDARTPDFQHALCQGLSPVRPEGGALGCWLKGVGWQTAGDKLPGMSGVHPCPLPPGALLARYSAATGAYADCYRADVARSVTQAHFVETFYTGGLFRVERLLLRLFLSRPSTDGEVRQLAAGEIPVFAAWRVEDRAPDQLLLCDITGRTRSWLMAAPSATGGTRLYFGSAVVPVRDLATGRPRMGAMFTLLLGFHRLYSRLLLGSARARCAR